jgi:crotonobetainyl-CoA:carnitine CoA-transferase CaiB-like acyl-CoA transferase
MIMSEIQPLTGVRVLDLSLGLAGPLCARLLADLGADVIKVEPPGGDWARTLAPFAGDAPDPDKSLTFIYRNLNKRGAALDRTTVAGRTALAELLAGADLVIDSAQPGTPEYLLDGAIAIPKSVVWVSITPFGLTGPYATWAGPEIVAYAMGGMVWALGHQGRAPVKHGLYQGANETALHAAAAALGALRRRDETGRGQQIDVSMQEIIASVLQGKTLDYTYMGVIIMRPPSGQDVLLGGTVPAADGELVAQFTLSPNMTWELFAGFLEEPALLDPKFSDQAGRMAHREELDRLLLDIFPRRKRHEWFHAAQEWRLTYGAVQTTEDLRNCPQLAAREFFAAVDQPGAGRLTLPGPLYKSTVPAFRPPRPAPPLSGDKGTKGQGDEASWSARPVEATDRDPNRPPRPVALSPLAGVRILECSEAYAIPWAMRLLADLGAEVIKIESPTRPDTSRGGLAYPDGKPSGEYWNQASIHHEPNRNKRNFGLNLQPAEGKAIFHELIKTVDIFAQNFAPRVMKNFGLDYESLRKVKPDLIYISSSGYGQTGPWRDYVAWGMTLEPMCGLAYLTGYPNGPAVRNPTGGGVDMPSAAAAALATLAALRHRDRTGEGQHIDLAQYEAAISLIGEALLDHSANGRLPRRIGNRDPNRAPQGVYACAGREQWLAISVGADAEWVALCEALGRPELARDARFATLAARQANHDALDALIEEWTRDRDRDQTARALQARGVAAGPVFHPKDLLLDPHLLERRFFRRAPMDPRAERLNHRIQPGPVWQLSETPVQVRNAAPGLGCDNDYIMYELLGHPASERERLREAGVVDNLPAAYLRALYPAMPQTIDQMVASGRALAHDPDYQQILAAAYGPPPPD